MPFVRVATNLSRNQLPKDFMPKFTSYLATALDKDPEKFKWELETDRMMAQVGCQTEGTFRLGDGSSIPVPVL